MGNRKVNHAKGGGTSKESVRPFGPNVRRQLVPVFVEALNLHNTYRKQKNGNRTGNGKLFRGRNSPTVTTYKGTDRMDIATQAAPPEHIEGYSRLIESRPGFVGPQREPIPEPVAEPIKQKKKPKKRRKKPHAKAKTAQKHAGRSTHNTSPAKLRAMGLGHLIG